MPILCTYAGRFFKIAIYPSPFVAGNGVSVAACGWPRMDFDIATMISI